VTLKVSYSALSTYKSCPHKYKLNYIDKIRPSTISSAFIFGSAIDEAIESILNKNASYASTFKNRLTYPLIDNKEVYAPKSADILYSIKDYQSELIEDEDVEEHYILVEEFGFEKYAFDAYMQESILRLRNDRRLQKDEQILYNNLCWFSLYRKGLLLLNEFKTWFDENIDEVISTQTKIELTNADGDTLVGALDFKAKFKDGITRIIDIKTSSNPGRYYPDDCIKDSVQLAIYSEADGEREVGYFVLDKNIRKREPRVRYKYVSGKIEDNQLNQVFSDIQNTMDLIKEEKFDKNLDSCNEYGDCVYRDLCAKGSMKGLIQKDCKEKEQSLESKI
jgi:hypothetical protein